MNTQSLIAYSILCVQLLLLGTGAVNSQRSETCSVLTRIAASPDPSLVSCTSNEMCTGITCYTSGVVSNYISKATVTLQPCRDPAGIHFELFDESGELFLEETVSGSVVIPVRRRIFFFTQLLINFNLFVNSTLEYIGTRIISYLDQLSVSGGLLASFTGLQSVTIIEYTKIPQAVASICYNDATTVTATTNQPEPTTEVVTTETTTTEATTTEVTTTKVPTTVTPTTEAPTEKAKATTEDTTNQPTGTAVQTILTTTEPTFLPTTSVHFEHMGHILGNNSVLPIDSIGERNNALLCVTNRIKCCRSSPNRFGHFYFPNGRRVPGGNKASEGMYRNRGNQLIRLNRRNGATSPTGVYQCHLPDQSGEIQKVYITLT